MNIWFTRYRAAFIAYHAALLMVAAHFGAAIFLGGSPITPELYGGAVYAIPALVWAGAQFAGEGASVIGAIIGGRKGAVLMFCGSLLALFFYAFLGAAASMAGQGVIVTAACLWLTGPGSVLSIMAAWKAMGDA